jgi:arginine exporter protein ArgO
MEVIKKLARSRKFWLAVFAVVQTIVLAQWPSIKPEVWQSIDALVAVLITMIAVEDSAATIAGK